MSRIRIMLAQNNQNGKRLPLIQQVSIDCFGHFIAKFETKDLLTRQCICNDRLLMLHGACIKYNHMTPFAGNIHWNLYSMMDHYALGFIRILQLSKQWECTEGIDPVYDKFNGGEIITGFDFELSEDTQPEILDLNQLIINYDKAI